MVDGGGARVARGGWVQMASALLGSGLGCWLAAGLQGCCNIELGHAMPQYLNRILAAHAPAHAHAHAHAVEEVCSIVR